MTNGANADKFTFKVEDYLEFVRDVELVQDGIGIVGGVNGTVTAIGGGSGSGGGDIFSYGWGISHNEN